MPAAQHMNVTSVAQIQQLLFAGVKNAKDGSKLGHTRTFKVEAQCALQNYLVLHFAKPDRVTPQVSGASNEGSDGMQVDSTFRIGENGFVCWACSLANSEHKIN